MATSFRSYIVERCLWYWVTITLVIITTPLILFVHQDTFPFIYLRYVLVAVFALFLLGYSLVMLLYPGISLELIQRLSLSVGMSLVLLMITGTFLYYLFNGINMPLITLSLFFETIVLSTSAIVRGYIAEKKDHEQKK
jgi:uncharacterized membrane protein